MSANDEITSDESRDGYLKLLVTAAVTHREKKLELHPHFHKAHVGCSAASNQLAGP